MKFTRVVVAVRNGIIRLLRRIEGSKLAFKYGLVTKTVVALLWWKNTAENVNAVLNGYAKNMFVLITNKIGQCWAQNSCNFVNEMFSVSFF